MNEGASNRAWEGKMCVMNILSAENKVVRREDSQAHPRTQRLDSALLLRHHAVSTPDTG